MSKAASVGAEALSLLSQGHATLLSQHLDIGGTIRDPQKESEFNEVLARLPDAFSSETKLQFQDDGRPFSFALNYDGQIAKLSGKVPTDLGPASQSAIMGRPVVAEALELAGIPADAEWWSAARTGLKAFGMMSFGSLSMYSHQISLRGTAQNQETVDEIIERLMTLEPQFKVDLSLTAAD